MLMLFLYPIIIIIVIDLHKRTPTDTNTHVHSVNLTHTLIWRLRHLLNQTLSDPGTGVALITSLAESIDQSSEDKNYA